MLRRVYSVTKFAWPKRGVSPIAMLLRSQMERPLLLTRKHRQALKDAEEASCNRRGIHDIDFCVFSGN